MKMQQSRQVNSIFKVKIDQAVQSELNQADTGKVFNSTQQHP